MEKEKYEQPLFEVINLLNVDIITESKPSHEEGDEDFDFGDDTVSMGNPFASILKEGEDSIYEIPKDDEASDSHEHENVEIPEDESIEQTPIEEIPTEGGGNEFASIIEETPPAPEPEPQIEIPTEIPSYEEPPVDEGMPEGE